MKLAWTLSRLALATLVAGIAAAGIAAAPANAQAGALTTAQAVAQTTARTTRTTRAAAGWCPEPEARQFDFWIGEWDVQNENRPPDSDQWYRTGRATNRVYAVVGGCGVVEHWRGYAWPAAGHIAGFSVRAWDPDAQQWELVLLWPVSGPGAFGNPEGRFEDGRGHFYNQFVNPDGDTIRTRLAFYDITDDAFSWSNGISSDDGATWQATWRMHATRRPATASGLWNGTSLTTDRCPAAEHRLFDRHLGEWTGTRVDPAGDSAAVRTWLTRIMDGCAIMERTFTDDGSWEGFAVRAFVPPAGRWVEYAFASDQRKLLRSEAGPVSADDDGAVEDATGPRAPGSDATASAGTPTFTAVEPAADGLYRRIRWTLDAGGMTRIEEVAGSPAGPWREVATTMFDARVPPAGGR